MPHDNSVFHAMLKLLPDDDLERSVERHGAAQQARDFSFKSQLVAMLYAQFSGASSLREIEAGMHSHANRLYHLGARPAPRATLADANRQRPVAVFADLLGVMIKRAHRQLRRVMDGATYLIDSTSLMLNQRSADWARFSAHACGAKLHVVYDPDADCPIYAAISAANVNDITVAQTMPIVAGATYVYDLGYYDYTWWVELDAAGCRIVTRLKRNTPLAVTETRAVQPGGAILSDRVGHLPSRQAYSRHNPFQKPVREVQVKIDTGKVLRIVTNDLTAPAQEIADLYKRRWAIELFFRWVKQTLKITRFIGTTENAVRIQIAVALIAFLLLRLAQATQTAITSPLTFARLVRANLMHLRSLRQLREPPQRAAPLHGQGILI
ncbi:MAG TPA: IS4 family transposase [Acetobacteraceae bacterium]|nr:IS4 family transposase [Acetobacteraceae bacterium]